MDVTRRMKTNVCDCKKLRKDVKCATSVPVNLFLRDLILINDVHFR
jgi:hypothetical protein